MVRQPRHLVLGMTDVEHRYIQLGVQALEIRQDLALALAVERSQGLIHQQQPGAGEQGPGDTDPLALATGQVVRRPLQQVGDAQQLAGMGQVHPPLLAGDALEAELQVGPHRQVREQAGFLEYIAQRPLVYRHKVLTLAVLPNFVIDLDIGLAGPFEPGDTAQAGGLA